MEPVSARVIASVRVPLFLSRRFRWVVYALAVILEMIGLFLIVRGAFDIYSWYASGNRVNSASLGFYALIGGGGIAIILGLAIIQLWEYFSVIREATVKEIAGQAYANLREGDFEQIERLNQIREEKAQADFERNLKDAFLIKSLDLRNVDFFGTSSWVMQPGVNILLGRNGYGKSLILRTLAGMLQRHEGVSKDLFKGASSDASIDLLIERNGVAEPISRNAARFTESAGRIPILAIPDSRFVNRRETALEAPTEPSPDLRSEGARHFLDDLPYGDRMRLLFNELCFDYLQAGNSFDDPVFSFLSNVIYQLTGDKFEFKTVERAGPNSFRILVTTEGNDQPVPIQWASQGMLSVLGVTGIVRSHLKSLAPIRKGEDFLLRPAIALIDELDAHLHPLWQQRLTSILRSTFPNVQFVLTAHSPLVVQGCWKGEVSILKRREAGPGFAVQLFEKDFVGASVETIYKEVFKVERVDPDFAHSATRATMGSSNKRRIGELESKDTLKELERRELTRLVREENIITRAATVRTQGEDDRGQIIQLKAKINALQDEIEAARKSP